MDICLFMCGYMHYKKKKNQELNVYQYLTNLHPEQCFVVKFPQTTQESAVGGGILRASRESKLASTTKYLEAVFFTRWSKPKAITKAVTMNCRNQLRSRGNPKTCIDNYAEFPDSN